MHTDGIFQVKLLCVSTFLFGEIHDLHILYKIAIRIGMYGRRIIEAIKFTLFYIAPYRNLIYERKSIERAMTELQHSIFCSTAIMQLFLV